MRYSSTPFRFFDFAFMILSSHTPSAANLTTRSSILESVFECLFRRSLSQLFQSDPIFRGHQTQERAPNVTFSCTFRECGPNVCTSKASVGILFLRHQSVKLVVQS